MRRAFPYEGDPDSPTNSIVQLRVVYFTAWRTNSRVSPGFSTLPVKERPGVDTPSQSLQSYSLARSMTAKGSVFAIFASYVKLGFRGAHVRVSPAAAAWRVVSAEVLDPPQPEASAPAERAMAASAEGLRDTLGAFHR